jgi:hypothetical protein
MSAPTHRLLLILAASAVQPPWPHMSGLLNSTFPIPSVNASASHDAAIRTSSPTTTILPSINSKTLYSALKQELFTTAPFELLNATPSPKNAHFVITNSIMGAPLLQTPNSV